MKTLKPASGLWMVALLMILLFGYSYFLIRPAMWSKLFGMQFISLLFSVYLVFTFKKNVVFIPKSPLIFLYGIFIISLLPSCIFAINPALAWSEFAKLLSFFLVFILAFIINSLNDLRRYFLRGLLVFVLISLFFAGVQLMVLSFDNLPTTISNFIQKWFGSKPSSTAMHQQTYFIKSLFAHRNLFAQLILLSMPFIGFMAYVEKGKWKHLSNFTLSAMLIPLVFLFVRSIWIVGFIGFFVAIFLLAKSSGYKVFRKKSSLLFFIIIVFWIALGIYQIQKKKVATGNSINENQWVKYTSFGSAKERITMWKATLSMIKENPFVGVGPNNWGIAFPKYSKYELRDVSTGHYTQFQRPHNDYLQIMAENGIFSFLLLALISIWIMVILLRKFFSSKNQQDKLWSLSLILFFVLYAGISFFSFPKERIEHQMLFALILALSLADQKTELVSQWRLHHPTILMVVISLFWVPLLWHSSKMMESDYNVRKAFQYKANGNESQYYFFKKAKQPFYNTDPNGTPIDWYISYQYSSLGNIPMAERYLKSALRTHPYHKQSLNDLGTIYYQTKGSKAAEKMYLKAHEISPDFVDANVNLSILKIKSAQYDSAWYYLSFCDTANYHNFYKPAIFETAKNIGLILMDRIDDSDSLLTFAVGGIIDNRDWIWLCHKHAIENNRNLMQQFVEEAVYVLLEMDKSIDLRTANLMRNKYKY